MVDIYGELENKNYNNGEYDLVIVIKNEDIFGQTAVLFDTKTEQYIWGEDFYYTTTNGTLKSSSYKLTTQGLFSINIEGRYQNPELVPAWLENLEIKGELDTIYLQSTLNQTGIFRPVHLSVELMSAGNLFFANTTVAFFEETGMEIGSCTSFEGFCQIEYIPDEIGNFSIYAEAHWIFSNVVNLLVEKWVLVPANEVLVRYI